MSHSVKDITSDATMGKAVKMIKPTIHGETIAQASRVSALLYLNPLPVRLDSILLGTEMFIAADFLSERLCARQLLYDFALEKVRL